MFIHCKYFWNAWKIQSWTKDTVSREQLKEKLQFPMERRYIIRDLVLNKEGLFYVPKGNGTFIVYDATKSLFNLALFCPSFYLPGIDSVLQNAN